MWRLGLRLLDLADWIELGDDYATELAAKAVVREHHPDTVFVALPEASSACQEILDVLVDHLTGTWPEHFCRRGSVVENGLTGESVAVDGQSLHPLDAASRLVQEDLVVMVERDDRLVFGAGSVCFPNCWDLRSKLGLSLRDVHAPVSLLNDQLGDTIDKFARLTPERSFGGWLGRARQCRPGSAGRRRPRPACTTGRRRHRGPRRARRCAVLRPAACCSRFARTSPRRPISPPIPSMPGDRRGTGGEAVAGAPVQADRPGRRGARRPVRRELTWGQTKLDTNRLSFSVRR